MNPSDQIIAKQIEWAKNKGLPLTGSRGDRGRKVYTTNVEDNLFQPLSDQTRANLEGGDGGELAQAEGIPAKIQALHSSAALAVNIFDYWRGSPDLSIITSSCGLSRTDAAVRGELRFVRPCIFALMYTSALSRLNYWVEFLESNPGIGSGKSPVNDGSSAVALSF